jgi:hypothetical protein
MPRRRTVYGSSSLQAFMDYLVRTDGPWPCPDAVVGGYQRRSYANHQALARFKAELDASGTRRVYLECGATVPISRMRFREPGDKPDLPSQEGVFGFGKAVIGLFGPRIRMSAPSVLEIADAWGDSVRLGTSAGAKFDEATWELDRWDYPATPSAAGTPNGLNNARHADAPD